MNTTHPLNRLLRSLTTLALLAAFALSGCSDNLMAPDRDDAPETVDRTVSTEKFRHAHLLGQAKRAGKDGEGRVQFIIKLQKLIERNGLIERTGLIERQKLIERLKLIERTGLIVRHEYDELFNGLAVDINIDALQDFIDFLMSDADVDTFEPDMWLQQIFSADGNLSNKDQEIPWGIERIGATKSWARSGDGSDNVEGVELYILDSGVNKDDIDIEEKMAFVETLEEDKDLVGHGTHVAGIAAGKDDGNWTVGVAPGLRVHSLKVLDDTGETDISNVVAALEYLVTRKMQNPAIPMVANLSFGADIGTTVYNAMDEAIEIASQAGIVVVVSAGNSGIDASTVTPAHAGSALTVGAYDVLNQFAYFSNYGPVVDLLAPGVDIPSMGYDASGNVTRVKEDGTSMAAPHVAGAAALYLAKNPYATVDQVKQYLLDSARPLVWGQPNGTTNRSVYVGDMDDLPPFATYAVLSNGDTKFVGSAHIDYPTFPGLNANLFSNSNLEMKSSNSYVQGFGYGKGSVKGYTNVYHPPFNPQDLPGAQSGTEEMVMPTLDVTQYEHLATKTTGKLELNGGTVQLGTREHPTIWYVDGDLLVYGATTFSGYGIFLVDGNVKFEAAVSNSLSGNETTLAFYGNGVFEVKNDMPLTLNATIFVKKNAKFEGVVEMQGSLTAWDGSVEFQQAMTLHYLPPSPALTVPIWGGTFTDSGSSGSGDTPPPPVTQTNTFEKRVSSSSDDVEERISDGWMYMNGSHLDMAYQGTINQVNGMRFGSVYIPQGATITKAYVQFTAYGSNSGTTNLTIRGQDADDAPTFSSSNYNASTRPKTSASASWSPTAWTTGAAGAAQRTSDLSAVVQEIVDRGGWSSGNGLVLLLTGSGERNAKSYDNSSSQAPLLHIEWQ